MGIHASFVKCRCPIQLHLQSVLKLRLSENGEVFYRARLHIDAFVFLNWFARSSGYVFIWISSSRFQPLETHFGFGLAATRLLLQLPDLRLVSFVAVPQDVVFLRSQGNTKRIQSDQSYCTTMETLKAISKRFFNVPIVVQSDYVVVFPSVKLSCLYNQIFHCVQN